MAQSPWDGDQQVPTPGRMLRSEMMARQIEEDIVVGKLPPGSRLGTKADLRERFKISPASVNEAVRMLEMRGLVEARPGPGGGLFVQASNPVIRLQHVTIKLRQAAVATVEKAMVIRRALEEPICQDAAQFHTKTQLRSLRLSVDDIDKQTEDDDYMRAVWRLHREVAAVTPNDMLREIYFGIMDVLEANLVSAHPDADVRARRNRDHTELVAAIASRDCFAVTKAVEQHNSSITEGGPLV